MDSEKSSKKKYVSVQQAAHDLAVKKQKGNALYALVGHVMAEVHFT